MSGKNLHCADHRRVAPTLSWLYVTLTGMIRIQLTEDVYTRIDDADQLLISGFPWRPLFQADHTYVHAWNGYQHVYMHRLIAGADDKRHVDHWDGDGLNNQRINLRVATRGQNQANRGRSRAVRTSSGIASQYKGVYWDSGRQRWSANVCYNKKTRSLGRHLTEEAAARAYDAAATEVWGRFARLNFPVETVVVCSFHGLAIPGAPCTCSGGPA